MTFYMNNRKWDIIEVNQKRMCEIENVNEDNEQKFYGLTLYDKQKIYLWQDLCEEQKRETLIHELFHCFLGCYVSFECFEPNIEVVCNLVGNSHDIIHNIVERYFEKVEIL